MSALVLVIDDDPGFLEPLKGLFEVEGIDAEYADSWDAGLAAFRVGQHELVIADYNLPGSEHGIELLAKIKDLAPATRVILMSGLIGAEQRPDVERVVDRFLEKVNDLGGIVEEARLASERSVAPVDWSVYGSAFSGGTTTSEDVRRSLDKSLRNLIDDGGPAK